MPSVRLFRTGGRTTELRPAEVLQQVGPVHRTPKRDVAVRTNKDEGGSPCQAVGAVRPPIKVREDGHGSCLNQ